MNRIIIGYERSLFDKTALDAFKALGADVMEYHVNGFYFENAYVGLTRFLPTDINGIVAVQKSHEHGYKPMQIVRKGNGYGFAEVKNAYLVIINE